MAPVDMLTDIAVMNRIGSLTRLFGIVLRRQGPLSTELKSDDVIESAPLGSSCGKDSETHGMSGVCPKVPPTIVI